MTAQVRIFLREFADDRIKYYYYIYNKKERKEEPSEYLVEVYMVDNKIINIDYNRQDELLQGMSAETWMDGGIIKHNGDTLTGMIYTNFANDDKKIAFKHSKTEIEEKLAIQELNGYFLPDFSFKKVYLNKEKDAMVRLVSGMGGSMQLYADYKERSQGSGMPFGPNSRGLSLMYMSTYLHVNYFVKKENSDDIIKLDVRQVTTDKNKVKTILRLFGDYPRLASAVIQGLISHEKAIVNIYNLYESSKNKK